MPQRPPQSPNTPPTPHRHPQISQSRSEPFHSRFPAPTQPSLYTLPASLTGHRTHQVDQAQPHYDLKPLLPVCPTVSVNIGPDAYSGCATPRSVKSRAIVSHAHSGQGHLSTSSPLTTSKGLLPMSDTLEGASPDDSKLGTKNRPNAFLWRSVPPTTLICLSILLFVSFTQITGSMPFTKFIRLVKLRFEAPLDVVSGAHGGVTNETKVDTPTAFKKSLPGNVTVPSISFPFSKRDRATLIQHSFKTGARGRDRRQTVVVTVASYDIREMVQNLQCFVRQTTHVEPVLFSLDWQMHDYAKRHGIPSIAFYDYEKAATELMSGDETDSNANFTDSASSGAIADPQVKKDRIDIKKLAANASAAASRTRPDGIPVFWGTKAFSGISNIKLEVVYQVLRHGYDVILSDVDIAWCTNMRDEFARFMARFADIDIFMQSNRLKDGDRSRQVNTGFYYAKSNAGVLRLFSELSRGSARAIEKGQDDQSYFHSVMCRNGLPYNNRTGAGAAIYTLPDGMIQSMCYWGGNSVRLMLLPLKRFPNGARDPFDRELSAIPRAFYREMCKAKNVSIWHVNYVKANMKRAVMNDQKVWIRGEGGRCENI